MYRKMLIVAAMMLMSGCKQYGRTSIESERSADSNFAVVKTYFATDRNVTESSKPGEIFGSERSKMSYGVGFVSIPRDHQMGELESPSIWRFEFREDPEKHVVLMGVDISTKYVFFAELSEEIQYSEGNNAFLFVHGYNVSFEDAARRTAQISYDLGFDGAPVFYSWPAQGKTAAYTIDEQNIEWSQANIKVY